VSKNFLLLTAFVVLFSISSFSQKTQKIAYVDSKIILNALPEAIKAQSDLENLSKKWQNQLDSIANEVQKMYQDYQKKASTMSQEKQREAQQAILAKEQAYQLFRQEKFGQGGEFFQKQEQLLNPIKERILKTIEQIAKEEGYAFVLDKNADFVVLFADDDYDLTYKVLDRMRKKNKK
jgi:outer membrane protein